jgi:hypothetical protein
MVNLTLTTQRLGRGAKKRVRGMDAAKPLLHNNERDLGALKRDRFVP